MPHVLPDGERGSPLEDMRTFDQLLLSVLKHAGSSTRKPGIPANIRVDGLRLNERDREHMRRRLGEKLGRHAKSVDRVTVRLRDVNGPRGGVDVQCRIKVVLNGLPSVVVEQRATAFRLAFTEALAGAERTVRRALQRRRMRPVRVGR